MGLLAAVEMWVRRDHEAEWREWLRRLEVIGGAVNELETVETAVNEHTGRSNVAPGLNVTWDPEAVGLDGAGAAGGLSSGEPRIEVFHGERSVQFNPYMMEAGEEEVVARRLRQVLAGQGR